MRTDEILVVDDTAENLEVVSQILEDAGYDVATVLRGEHALELAQGHPPDLILLDVMMPGIDGFETCQKLAGHAETAAIPVIFMTALNDIDSKVKGFDCGAVDYITKPFQAKELLARVKTHLQLRQYEKELEGLVAERTYNLKIALEKLEQSQLEMVQHEKMSTLGSLVAGIAHEVNNPLNFIKGNVSALKYYFQDIAGHLKLYERTFPSPGVVIEANRQDLDIDFILDDVPKIMSTMESGCRRLYDISSSLRTFTRSDVEVKIKTGVHEILDSIALILKYRLKANDTRSGIKVLRDYGEVADISCFPSQLGQVFMNVLANAIDVFDEMAEDASDHASDHVSDHASDHENHDALMANVFQITIRTRQIEAHSVEICISDNGKGMSEAVCAKVFDRTFTTKTVGKGTGLGLAIAREIVVNKHKGTMAVTSEVGKGSQFIIRLPIDIEP